MAGILLFDSNLISETASHNARAAFHNKKYKLKESKFKLGKYVLYYYRKHGSDFDQIFKSTRGDLLCACGSLLFENKTGDKALQKIHQELSDGKDLKDIHISGNYVLLAFVNDNIFITRDLFGGEVCYNNDTKAWFTTNFLSAINLIADRNFHRRELLEYILYGFVFGDVTIINGIYILNPTKVHDLKKKSEYSKTIEIPQLNNDYNSCLEECVSSLLNEFEFYKKTFENNIVSALSGGFDTRLMLVLQLKLDIQPNLYVYGNENYIEVKIAKEISKKESLHLMHVNKSLYEKVSLDQFAEVMTDNLWGLDGYVSVGLIGDQSDLNERMNRGDSNGILLNGAGGEAYRDVWRWDFAKTSISNLISASYNTGELSYLGIDEREFFSNIEEKLARKLNSFFKFEKYITRQQAEMVFPIYRSNFYFSNNSLDNYFCNSQLPFLSEPVTLQSFSIPAKFKHNGRFEMDMINMLNPRVASYQTSYGINFHEGYHLKQKAIHLLYRNLTPKQKAILKNATGKSKKSLFKTGSNPNPYLDRSYLSRILNLNELEIFPKLANIEIKNPVVLNRIYSLEYLAQKFNIGWE